MRLPEADVEAFEIFAQWIYGKEAVYTNDKATQAGLNDPKTSSLIVKTYVIADQLGSLELQNQAIDDYISASNKEVPDPVDVKLACAGLPEQCMMRKAMVDDFVAQCELSWLKKNHRLYPEEFIRDLMVGYVEAMARGQRPDPIYDSAKCEYHVHNDDVPKCRL